MTAGTSQRTATPLLRAADISKAFPGVQALANVSFELLPGEVHALVGENGAGKSTLMKIMGGIQPPDTGAIQAGGRPVTLDGPLAAQEHGISIIHQEFNLMPDLSVAENIFIGREPRSGLHLDDAEMSRRARTLLDRLHLDLDPDQLVGTLTVATQQMVEIAKALSVDARVLIMDEPTAALTDTEVETLFSVIEEFVSPTSAVVYVSHRLEEITRISDRITVLRDGRHVVTRPTADMSVDDIIHAMVGRQIDVGMRPEPTAGPLTPALTVTGLTTPDLLRDVSFTAHRGEILGFAGLMGAGRTEVARAVFGADPRSGGTIAIGGREADIRTPTDAVAAGLGYLSEDRKDFGLALGGDVTENIALPSLSDWSTWWGRVDEEREEAVARDYVDSLGIRTPGIRQATGNLSGGNQQKVVLAKWLAKHCDILIVDEPTRGIDVGAKDEIYALLTELRNEGAAVIVISSDIPELLRVADRILVMASGRITGQLTNDEATAERIMALATATAPSPSKDA